MKDPVFIQQMIQYGREAGEKVKQEFSTITPQQLNWKPGEDNWSIGQCLDHLILSDCAYFPTFKKIAEGEFKESFWENWSPFGGFFGRMMVFLLQEKVKKKMNAPKKLLPSESKIEPEILERFQKHLDSFIEYINDCRMVDIDKTHITSPVSGFVTYSLRNTIKFLVQHEHRHINQAIKIKNNKNFPV
ncbi:MAG: DinB family protein [Chitinophagaceae bacterium]|nr:DinB family protein [Chitinophagaceae bacterium]